MTLSLPLSPWDKLIEVQCVGSAVLRAWCDFPRQLLIPTGEYAHAIACDHPQSACYRKVVRHDEDDIEAVCCAKGMRCDNQALTRADITAYRLDEQQLFEHCANAMAIVPRPQRINGCQLLWQIGEINPGAQRRLPVYTSLANETTRSEQTLQQLCLQQQQPFTLILPTRRFITQACLTLARQYSINLMSIDDLLTLGEDNAVQPHKDARQAIDSWLTSVSPRPDKPSEHTQFPTPVGISWEDITITFLARDIIRINCKGSIAINWERLHIPGMAVNSNREKTPSDRWWLLMALAMNNGTLAIREAESLLKQHSWYSIRKQKSLLAQALKHFFGLSDEPISFDRVNQVYRTRFKLRQDSNCDLRVWMGDRC